MKRLPAITIALILFFCFLQVKNHRWSKDYDEWTVTIVGDGYGYWAYLPAIVINHNLDFRQALQPVKKIRKGVNDDYINAYVLPADNGGQINKCFAGLSVLMLPFFLIICLVAKIYGYDVDGFSYPFQLGASIIALFYLFVGLFYLTKLLRLYSVRSFVISCVLAALVFATNLYYYVTMEPTMPHVFDFALMSVFLYFIAKSIREYSFNNVRWAAAALGIAVIIRPTNVLILLAIPLLAGSWALTVEYVRRALTSSVTYKAAVIFFMAISIQLLLWKSETGHWFVWSYPGEGFNFSKPHFTDILFSYRKGWFVYTPIMFLGLFIVLYVFFRQNWFRLFYLLGFFTVITYVLSSWWMWSYGASFGARPFIDFYPVFAFAIALGMNSISTLTGILVLGLTFICAKVNLIQEEQYEKFIMLKDGMDRAKYWKIFLHTDASYIDCLIEKNVEEGYTLMDKYNIKNDFEQNLWTDGSNLTSAVAHTGRRSAFAGKTSPYSPAFADTVSGLPKQPSGKLAIFVKLWVNEPDTNNNAKLIVSVEEKGKSPYFYTANLLKNYIDSCNTWKQVECSVELPATFKNNNDILKIYVYTERGIVYVDDEEIKFGYK